MLSEREEVLAKLTRSLEQLFAWWFSSFAQLFCSLCKLEAELLRRILQNRVQGGPKEWVLMNAAMLLYAAGKGDSLAACFPVARAAVEGGAAARKLEELAHTPVAA